MKKTASSAQSPRRQSKPGQRPAARAGTAGRPAKPSAPAQPTRFARQDDQDPPASLDRCWGNLHPARVWPD